MLEEAISKIVELAERPKLYPIDGKTYLDGDLKLLSPPMVPAFELMTLTGLVDLINAKPGDFNPKAWLIDIISYRRVIVRSTSDDGFGRRAILADCGLEDGESFPFGRFIDRDSFTIGLMSQFIQSLECKDLMKLTSSITTDATTISEDDGISQQVTVKQGVALKEIKVAKPRWTLQPFRTFREVEQPASEFVFRLRGQAGAVPGCMLIEADGGKWKLDAVLGIKAWLEEKKLGLPIVA